MKINQNYLIGQIILGYLNTCAVCFYHCILNSGIIYIITIPFLLWLILMNVIPVSVYYFIFIYHIAQHNASNPGLIHIEGKYTCCHSQILPLKKDDAITFYSVFTLYIFSPQRAVWFIFIGFQSSFLLNRCNMQIKFHILLFKNSDYIRNSICHYSYLLLVHTEILIDEIISCLSGICFRTIQHGRGQLMWVYVK